MENRSQTMNTLPVCDFMDEYWSSHLCTIENQNNLSFHVRVNLALSQKLMSMMLIIMNLNDIKLRWWVRVIELKAGLNVGIHKVTFHSYHQRPMKPLDSFLISHFHMHSWARDWNQVGLWTTWNRCTIYFQESLRPS